MCRDHSAIVNPAFTRCQLCPDFQIPLVIKKHVLYLLFLLQILQNIASFWGPTSLDTLYPRKPLFEYGPKTFGLPGFPEDVPFTDSLQTRSVRQSHVYVKVNVYKAKHSNNER